MSGTFFDTSAFIKYYYPEEGSSFVEDKILNAKQVVVSEIIKVEIASALIRKVRMKEISRDQHGKIWTTFLADLSLSDIRVLPIDTDQLLLAVEIINIYGENHLLRSLDSIQLAAAQTSGVDTFICSDKKLGETAKIIFSETIIT